VNAYRSFFIASSSGTGSSWSTAGSITLLTVAARCSQAKTSRAVESGPAMAGLPASSNMSPPLAKTRPHAHPHQVSCSWAVRPIGNSRMPASLIRCDCCSSSSRLFGGAEIPAFARMASL
jgi:hypothetical protein